MTTEAVDLKTKTIADLLKMAEDLDIPGVSGLRKSELIYKVMEAKSSESGALYSEGVLEILDEGYGFLRSPNYNYLPGPDDIYVSPSQIKRFDLSTGDTIAGQVRPPKDSERYFALLKIESINYQEPEVAKHKIYFDNLTPLYPNECMNLETTPEEMTGRIMDL
ncbi:MAG: Rho termination factor N-terminal domain-containing protein, partial [candidate division Zixibacteria bacterium]|nr:Rho termination factor N-terminal domain-containing protein [candidate division Zixibacteria bacterium]